jgi:monothiol glutaredoxin
MSIEERIKDQLSSHRVILYMKGSPDFPQCGFSAQVAGALKQLGGEFAFVNILEDQELREGLKAFANWPTFPQLWVDGELVGGCDIVTEMYESGELAKLVKQAA